MYDNPLDGFVRSYLGSIYSYCGGDGGYYAHIDMMLPGAGCDNLFSGRGIVIVGSGLLYKEVKLQARGEIFKDIFESKI